MIAYPLKTLNPSGVKKIVKKAPLLLVVLSLFSYKLHANETGFFFSAFLGVSIIDIEKRPTINTDVRATTYGVNVGYMFNDYIGTEAGYRALGEASITATALTTGNAFGANLTLPAGSTLSVKADGVFLGMIGNMPVSDNFDVYAKGGVFAWDTLYRNTGPLIFNGLPLPGGLRFKLKGEEPYLGIGASCHFADIYSISAEWTRYFDVSKMDVDVIGANLAVRF